MTFTAIAVEPGRGVMGIASASCSLAVGNAVPALDPRAGVVATQAWTNRSFRAQGLARLRQGLAPEDVLADLARSDDGFELRQVAVVDRAGNVGVHTGARCTEWSGAVTGDGAVAIGNYLAGPGVLDRVAVTLAPGAHAPRRSGDGGAGGSDEGVAELASRLLDALDAGQAAGGDRRGEQSAYLQVARILPPPTAPSTSAWPAELDLDLRVDDAPRPLAELRRLLGLWLDQDPAAGPPT